MKIGILTHYDVNNLGAQLQMFALYNWLEDNGHEPVILTYNKNFDFEFQQKLRNQISLKSVPYITREFLLKKGIAQTWHNIKKYYKIKKFRKTAFKSEFYANSNAHVIIVGADEVLSIPVGINYMMYGYGMLSNCVIAYAPSFGETTMYDLEQHHARVLVGEGLKTFVGLSARDEHTMRLMQELTGREIYRVCDPVILYDFSQIHSKVRQIEKPYLAIYSYDRNMVNPDEVIAIKSFAKKRNLLTVSIGNFHKWCDKNVTCTPLEWLDYMRDAQLIITDTFHGAVVSTILHKEVAIMTRTINGNKLTALMQDTMMTDRAILKVTTEELNRVFAKETNYSKVDDALNKMRNDSEAYLRMVIEQYKTRETPDR